MAYYDSDFCSEQRRFPEIPHSSRDTRFEVDYTGSSGGHDSLFMQTSFSRIEQNLGSNQGCSVGNFQQSLSLQGSTDLNSQTLGQPNFHGSAYLGVRVNLGHNREPLSSSASIIDDNLKSTQFTMSADGFGRGIDANSTTFALTNPFYAAQANNFVQAQQNQLSSALVYNDNQFSGQRSLNQGGFTKKIYDVGDYDCDSMNEHRGNFDRGRHRSRSPLPNNNTRSKNSCRFDKDTDESERQRRGERYSSRRDRDRSSERRDRSRRSRYSPNSRDRGRASSRDDSGFAEQDNFERHSRRRSRGRDREHDRDRERRHRDSDRESRHRHADRDRDKRHQDRERDWSREQDEPDEGMSRSPKKEVPWVPPPLPEHLRQVPTVPPPLPYHQQQHATCAVPWVPPPIAQTTPTSSKPAVPQLQNQFQNDGSFLAMFRQKMQNKNSTTAAEQQSEDSNHSDALSTACSDASGTVGSGASGLTSTKPALPSSGLPVIAKRRISKILKTGVVEKPKKDAAKELVAEANGSDAWSRYMNEVQKYRANKCIEDESCRPLMK